MKSPAQAFPGQQVEKQEHLQQQQHPVQSRHPVQPWHNAESDTQLRADIVNRILIMFKKLPTANLEGLQALTSKLEQELYHHAPSRADYSNIATLKQRVMLIARRGVGNAVAAGGAVLMPPYGSQHVTAQNYRGQGNVVPQASAQSGASNAASAQTSRLQFRGSMESLTPEQRLDVVKQQRWLVFLRHCSKCIAQGTSCSPYGRNCAAAKQLWEHILKCHSPDCRYPRCSSTRDLLKHHQKCDAQDCLICVHVRRAIQKHRQAQQQVQSSAEQIRENIEKMSELHLGPVSTG